MRWSLRVSALIFSILCIIGIGAFETSRREARAHGATGPDRKNAIVNHEQSKATATAEDEGDGLKGPDEERYYFERWHQKYGAVLPPEVLQEIWNEIDRMPSEDRSRSVNSWQLLGPSGMANVNNAGTYYSGRILDIGDDDSYFRIGAASGGLWEPVLFFVVPMSDAVASLAVGSFVTVPGTSGNTIVLGTGEPGIRGGTGLYKTTDGGTTWILKLTGPSAFYKVRCTRDLSSTIHAASTGGYYRSDDTGESWTRHHGGNVTDVAVSGTTDNLVYIGIWGDGLYKSTDGGNTFTKMTGGGIPTTNVGRTSICMGSTPSHLYVQMERNDNDQLLGIFRTTDSGTTWQDVTPATNIVGGQGWYDNVVASCPGNPSIALAGGIGLWRTTDGGSSWNQVSDPNVHADQHSILWIDQNSVYVGSDGGVCYSSDAGATWTSSGNLYPITQYVNFGVGVDNTNVIFGGSQDNGFSGTTDGGTTWNFTYGGDGGGISIDPNSATRIWGTLGIYQGNWRFRRHRSTDTGQTWDNTINNGIDPDTQWFTKIRNDQVNPVFLYTNSGPWVYKSTDYGSNWTKLNGSAFPSNLNNLNVTAFSGGYSVIYASLAATPILGQQLRVYDSGTWYERSTGLPHDVWVRGVALHETDTNKAYALMSGFDDGQKVFKTTDRGQTWTNISGNLPNVPMGDLVPHPTNDNILVVGTEFGCYRTSDGGTTWERWNNGMPEANIITEMSYIDKRSSGGAFTVVACSYGRAIWSRDIGGSEPAGVADSGTGTAKLTALQNYPNPFSASTTISFTLPKVDAVDLSIYDVSGRVVLRPLHATLAAGRHSVLVEGSALSPGAYWYRLKDGNQVVMKKMLRIR